MTFHNLSEMGFVRTAEALGILDVGVDRVGMSTPSPRPRRSDIVGEGVECELTEQLSGLRSICLDEVNTAAGELHHRRARGTTHPPYVAFHFLRSPSDTTSLAISSIHTYNVRIPIHRHPENWSRLKGTPSSPFLRSH